MWHTAQKVMRCAHDKHEKHHGHDKNMQKNLFPDLLSSWSQCEFVI